MTENMVGGKKGNSAFQIPEESINDVCRVKYMVRLGKINRASDK